MENCQRENSSVTYAGMKKKNSKPTENRLSAENKTTVIESDVCNDIKKMVKKLIDEVDNVRKSQTSMEYRLSDVENIKMSDGYIKNPTRGDNSGYRQNDRSRTLRKCNQFAQTGNCKYGEHCKFSNQFNPAEIRRAFRDESRNDLVDESVPSYRNDEKKEKVLLIGSSVLKGIKPVKLRGEVDVWAHRGATVLDIYNDLRKNIDLSVYHTVLIHVGGNDASSGKNLRQFINIYSDMIKYVKSQNCRVMVSEILPRVECDVRLFNSKLYNLSYDDKVTFVSNREIFMSQNSGIVKRLFVVDGVHLNNYGTIQLLRNFNKYVSIIHGKSSYDYNRSYRYNSV